MHHSTTPEQADSAIADFFYECNVPFSAAGDRAFLAMCSALVNTSSLGGYTPPKPHRVAGSLLDDAVRCMDEQIKKALGGDATRYGLFMMTDGWTNVNQQSPVNFLLSSPSKTVYLTNVDTEHQQKTKEYIAQITIKTVEEHPYDVCHIVMDGANQGALAIVEKELPAVLTSLCVCHCLDLIFEDVFSKKKATMTQRFSWCNAVVKEMNDLLVFVKARAKVIEMLRKESELRLLIPNETRFRTQFIARERVLLLKEALQTMFVSSAFEEWRKGCKTADARANALRLKEAFVADAFWDKAESVKEVGEAIYVAIRFFDTNPSVEHVVAEYEKMREKIAAKPPSRFFTQRRKDDLLQLLESRWVYTRRDIHLVAYLLSPRYRHDASLHDGGIALDALHRVVPRLVPCDIKQLVVYEEYSDFLETLFEGASDTASREWEGYRWWQHFGRKWSHLQPVAMRVLAQRATVSPCERAWSSYSHVQTKTRNRLSSTKASALTRLYFHKKTTSSTRTTSSYWATRDLCEADSDDDDN